MRILKLVIWDLDETILTGVLEEGDKEVSPLAGEVMGRLQEQGILQALATQNPPRVLSALEEYDWFNLFVHSEADLGPKVRKVERILEKLGVNPLDVAFVDEDPFERGALSAQIPDITVWSVGELASFLVSNTEIVTEEGKRRQAMYREQQARIRDAESATNYTEFLEACNIEITIRPYVPEDESRVKELLTRTHRMNLGVLPVDEAIARLNQPSTHTVLIADMKDIYGDMGRCGIIHLIKQEQGDAVIESLAVSCRTRARGLSLAMLVGLLRYAGSYYEYHHYFCRYVPNGVNRPLRMLLLGAGFKPLQNTDQLLLTADYLAKVELPHWVHLKERPVLA
jgi:FkbH-like protein